MPVFPDAICIYMIPTIVLVQPFSSIYVYLFGGIQ
jgi:hypothetical protein